MAATNSYLAYSKLIFVRKKHFNRPCDACENSNSDIKEPIVYLRKT